MNLRSWWLVNTCKSSLKRAGWPRYFRKLHDHTTACLVVSGVNDNYFLIYFLCTFVFAAGFLQGGEDPVHSGSQSVPHRSAYQHHCHLFFQVNTHLCVRYVTLSNKDSFTCFLMLLKLKSGSRSDSKGKNPLKPNCSKHLLNSWCENTMT